MQFPCRLALVLLSLLSLVAAVPAPAVSAQSARALPISERDYTFGYWLNGVRKQAADLSPHVLCLKPA